MILSSPARLQPGHWQRDLAEAISDPHELLALLNLDVAALPGVDTLATFPLRVTRYFAGLMEQGNPHDPLLAQVLPLRAERLDRPGYTLDPVGDLGAVRQNAVLQKYHGRALAIATGACAVHCRYCFRRHFPYAEQSLLGQWEASLHTLGGMHDVEELILSGGDPLSLSDARLAQLIDDVQRLPQLTRLRIHTRLPVVLPNRVTPALCDMLRNARLRSVIVIHVNHANEITPQLAASLALLRGAGATLLNQSVLLKNINDDADTLLRLSDALFAAGALPYYLHLLDPVAGAAHFDVDEERARDLLRQLQTKLPGYLVPRLVREIPGAPHKTPVAY